MINTNEVNITRDVLNEYYDCMKVANEYFDDSLLKRFSEKYPLEYKRLNTIHRKRCCVNSNVEALKTLNEVLYFGTLTFDETKDHNQIATKRKEAFAFLNSLFEFVLLVEEYGENKGRYHVHFVGNFKEGKTFNDFVNGWHSRQNIEVINETKKVSQYLCKYLSKQVPRIRRNKKLIQLETSFKKHKVLKKSFPTVFDKNIKQDIFTITAFDL